MNSTPRQYTQLAYEVVEAGENTDLGAVFPLPARGWKNAFSWHCATS